MTIAAALTILYNVTTADENRRQANAHPIITVLSGGSNLKPAYNFTPPLSGFEKTIIAMGAIGVALILFGPEKNNER